MISRFVFLAFSLSAVTLSLSGCEQAEYEAAVEQYQEEKGEAEQAAEVALQDGVVDREEREEVQEKVDDARSAYGEAAEQKGDLVGSKLE